MSRESSSADDETPSVVELFTSFTPITEYPLPFSDGLDEFIETHPEFDADDDISVDELHQTYVNRIAKNHSWTVFTVTLHGYENRVYVWNRELGEGIAVPREAWTFGNFSQVLSLANDADEAWNQSADPVSPDSDGCPYCEDVSGEDLSGSTMPGSSHKQGCPECGQSRLIG
jgi:hypothetical protein